MPKKNVPLWQITAVVTAESEDAVSVLLSEVYEQPASSYTQAATGRTTVAVYVDRIRGCSRERAAEFQAGVKRLQSAGFERPVRKFTCDRLGAEDWAESWKQHFKPFQIGRDLLVRPSWSARRPKSGQAEIVIDPGLSFGTGQHPTTRFCLEQIVRARRESVEPSCLDLGTGSGILAIAASKLGYRTVEAVDFDADAVRIARRNARANGVDRQIRIHRQDLTQRPIARKPTYDVICANLMADLLMAERPRILSYLRPGGSLILAGILHREFPGVKRAFAQWAGLRFITSQHEAEWHSGVFRRA